MLSLNIVLDFPPSVTRAKQCLCDALRCKVTLRRLVSVSVIGIVVVEEPWGVLRSYSRPPLLGSASPHRRRGSHMHHMHRSIFALPSVSASSWRSMQPGRSRSMLLEEIVRGESMVRQISICLGWWRGWCLSPQTASAMHRMKSPRTLSLCGRDQ